MTNINKNDLWKRYKFLIMKYPQLDFSEARTITSQAENKINAFKKQVEDNTA